MRSRGEAAAGTLMTLSLKQENDTAEGSLPRRELSTGLRDGDASAAGLNLAAPFGVASERGSQGADRRLRTP